ncbi:hypothetical protein HELRODRAFT_192218 [Helobdella robusta]|uniref:SURF1-like protein n=1 Tax=Helobdella robusta TaxID=6412 RepID=T1FTQ2_HELRO|nr:hypothetical protein HELRODRAFT_192218 [Helobdella robusta]ESO01639.1 hypothetical protein HELRODRAFT_192218 [Helobdella robusta]
MYRHCLCGLLKVGQLVVPSGPFTNRIIYRFSNDARQSYRQMQKKDKKDVRAMGYVLLVIPVSALMLGIWQIRRRKWKLELIEEMESKVNHPPVPLPSDPSEIATLDYRKVKVRGKFDHSREAYILPRVNIQSLDKNAPTQGGGAYVVTPFRLEDGSDTILVNRGWVPRSRIDPETRRTGQIDGVVDLVGVVRTNEKRPQYSSTHDASRNVWHVRDVGGIAQQLGTSPIFIDADAGSTVEGGPIGGQTKVSLRNDHLQYIITWFVSMVFFIRSNLLHVVQSLLEKMTQ